MRRHGDTLLRDLHRSPTAKRGETLQVKVWCQNCKSDKTKRTNHTCRYEVATSKYVAWHVFDQVDGSIFEKDECTNRGVGLLN